MITLEELVKQAYQAIGRGQKLRPEQFNDALTALDIMFKSWSNKGDDLWRVSKYETPLRLVYGVEFEGKKYLPIRHHVADSDNSPSSSIGFWLPLPEDFTPSTVHIWTNGSTYENNMALIIALDNVFTIGNVRVFERGQRLKFRLVSRHTFDDKVIYEIGKPTFGKVGRTFLSYPTVTFNAMPISDDVMVSVDLITHANTVEGLTDVPSNWLAAIKYGLAVELGYANGIDPTSLTAIVNKFQYEYRRAKGSERETVSSCFVEPLY